MNIMAICHMGTPKNAFLGKKDEPALGVPFIMILLSLLLFVKNGGDPHTNTNQPTVGKGHDLDISLGYPSRSQCSWSILSGLISFHVFFQSSLVSIWVCLKIGYPLISWSLWAIYFPYISHWSGHWMVPFPWLSHGVRARRAAEEAKVKDVQGPSTSTTWTKETSSSRTCGWDKMRKSYRHIVSITNYRYT